eukprot:788318-Pyramimonas_sp.AAC.1
MPVESAASLGVRAHPSGPPPGPLEIRWGFWWLLGISSGSPTPFGFLKIPLGSRKCRMGSSRFLRAP